MMIESDMERESRGRWLIRRYGKELGQKKGRKDEKERSEDKKGGRMRGRKEEEVQ